MFEKFFKYNVKKIKVKIYRSIVKQSRQQSFYTIYGVPDTPDGRFDMITIHAFLVIRRLNNEATNNLAQKVFDLMFTDMDQNLREMGSGDTGIAKKVMAMAEAFYGRINVYEKGLNDLPYLKEALNRNLFREAKAKEVQIRSMAIYMKKEANRLQKIDMSEILKGDLSFRSPPNLLSDNNEATTSN